MTDEQLFQTARLINSAMAAKVHTTEWTPAVLANTVMFAGMHVLWDGFPIVKYPAAPGNPNPDPLNVPYQFPEEFISIYRMHPILPDTFPIKPIGSTKVVEQIPLSNVVSFPDLFNSFATSKMGALTLNNFPQLMTALQLPTGENFDMATIDLVRDRERGIPRYNEYRKMMLLPEVNSFSDITSNPTVASLLAQMYPLGVHQVDLLVGGLAEDSRPDGFAFSETIFRLFTVVASRRITADRFFTTDFRPEVYTQLGMQLITSSNMSTILATNFPELTKPLSTVVNPFLVWDDAKAQGMMYQIAMTVQKKMQLLAVQLQTLQPNWNDPASTVKTALRAKRWIREEYL
ncbi:hypothetical protein HDU76_001704 [Blyttiomyces sp. JEL0837]|nr:hypothetical protein HDU76_001704 [Blyttiomyces sp. JEL0837]